ncbi:MAG TPA: hypothetical protein VID03_08695 [Acidimicrobiia bacterium]|jgi:hypothetical protein
MPGERPVLSTIDEHLVGDGVTVEVTLVSAGRAYAGQASGDAEPSHRARLVGEATLRAVESFTGGSITLDLTAMGTSDIGEMRVALAQVRERGNGDLVGSALIRHGDPVTAAAKAVLDAVNRRIGR